MHIIHRFNIFFSFFFFLYTYKICRVTFLNLSILVRISSESRFSKYIHKHALIYFANIFIFFIFPLNFYLSIYEKEILIVLFKCLSYISFFIREMYMKITIIVRSRWTDIKKSDINGTSNGFTIKTL